MWNRSCRTLVSTALLLFCAGTWQAARAVPNYTVTDRVNSDLNSQQSGSPGLSTSGSWFLQSAIFPTHIFSGDWFAQANQGSLAASITASQTWTAGGNSEAAAGASLSYGDIVFSSGDGLPIDVTLPLHLSGSLNTAVVGSRVTVHANLAGQNRSGSYRPATMEASGMLSGLGGGTIDTTLYVSYTNVPTNTPVGIFLSLGTDIFINGDNTGFANFGSTYGFVTGGPAFIVPAGIDVNSAEAGIVNNQFLVPEPGLVPLVAAVVLAVGGRRRRPQR